MVFIETRKLKEGIDLGKCFRGNHTFCFRHGKFEMYYISRVRKSSEESSGY